MTDLTINNINTPHYLCPLCQQALSLVGKSFICAKKHSFDQAKEGYVNLLPVQHKHSKDPGDNKAMVNARRNFLDHGFYQPLIAKLLSVYQEYGDDSQAVFDAGCGEGYYTHQHKNSSNTVYGIDIAKNAIRIAAKRYKECFFSVGTLAQLPFKNNFFGWVVSIYAPILEKEFSRVLNTNGYLLTVTPAENHLYELKQLIYRDAKQHDTSKTPIKSLTLISKQRINYTMNFTQSDDLINLLAMTPFAFKANVQLIEELKAQSSFNCQADFLIRLYQKIA
jgi:23S rRNA (guanine745-N1)-methyltransferase